MKTTGKKKKQHPNSLKNLRPCGTKGNKGGTGRPPDWFRQQCRAEIERRDLVARAGLIAGGDEIKQANGFGVVKKIPPPVSSQIKAMEALKDWAWGKSGKVEMHFVFEFVARVSSALNTVLPDQCPHCKNLLSLREETIKQLENLSRSMELETASE